MTPLLSRTLWPAKLLLTGLDRLLVYLATPFGVRVKQPGKRYAILLGIYAVIYVIGLLPIPYLPLVALTVGYIGVLAVGRAWALNEKVRTLIAKKLKDGSPDEMPDLRWTALVSALQLVILWPLIFQQVQWHFGLYTVPEGANFWTWVVFTLDSYNKAILGLLQVYGIHFDEVGLDSAWGRHLVTICRLTFDYLLIQGMFRLLAIRKTIRDAVAAAKADPNMAVRLGKRAVGPLIRVLQDTDVRVRQSAASALGQLGDARAVGPLLTLLQDQDNGVRSEVASALGQLGDACALEPLLPLLQDQDNGVRSEVASSLGLLRDARAVEPLLPLLQDQDSDVRYSAALSLGGLGDTRAVEPLLALLKDQYQLARLGAASSLGQLGDARAVEPLLPLLQDQDNGVRQAAASALGQLGDARGVEVLQTLLQDQIIIVP